MPRALTAALLTALLALSACNTMEGFGRDLENTGDAIEEEASD